jgi:protein disulfide-isomerase
MKRRNFLCLCAAAALMSASGAVARSKSVPAGWGEDLAAAQARAEKDGKLVLAAFSGSDWCGWCVKMDQNVYAKPVFVKGAGKNFELVMLDFPQDESVLSDLAKKQNPPLLRKYGVRGFPCAVVLRPDGTEVTRFGGYQYGGAEGFLKRLDDVAAQQKKTVSKPATAQ